MKLVLAIIFLIFVCATCNYFIQKDKVVSKPSIVLQYWKPKEGIRARYCYNDLIKLNDNQYLYVGKDGFGNTFDSTIITINK